MARLLIGPMLRHIGTDSATVWVETDRPCTVEVLGRRERTWHVSGHHYALVSVGGLAPGSCTPYDVRLDGELVWPPFDSTLPWRLPPSRIRTVDPARPLRLIFGSCRYATQRATRGDRHFDADALGAYARRMAGEPPERWPDALLLLGDQVYADEVSPQVREFIRRRRDTSRAPGEEVADFEEYTLLYRESWADPEVRWLFATVPSSMVFDDHDITDDWNTSHAWRVEMQATDWWQERVVSGLMSYWIYQHLGNLSPEALAADDLYRRVRSSADAAPILREFAAAADREADGQKGTQWSYRRDFGRIRLLVLDSRCGRVLAEQRRSMLGEREFSWVERQVEGGGYDHLLVGTSLPWLLPRALHDVESWNESRCAQARPAWARRLAELVRRAADLEHWAAFRASFDRLGRLLARVGRGEHGRPPASICVLSGDVHHAYVARAEFADGVRSPVYQVTCSPLHNYVPLPMELAFRVSWSRGAERLTRWLLSRFGAVPPLTLDWSPVAGPFFGDVIGTLVIDGPSAMLLFETATSAGSRAPRLTAIATLPLTSSARSRAGVPTS